MNLATATIGQLSIPVQAPAKAAGHAGPALYFRVGGIQAVHATLAAAGVAFGSPPHAVHRTATSTRWLAEFADPDGNALALMCDVPAGAA